MVESLGEWHRGGKRRWVTWGVATFDVLWAAVIGSRARPEEMVIDLPIDGELRIVGRSVPPRASTARARARAAGTCLGAPRPEQVRPGHPIRSDGGGRDVVYRTLVMPSVVEISADVAMTSPSMIEHVFELRQFRSGREGDGHRDQQTLCSALRPCDGRSHPGADSGRRGAVAVAHSQRDEQPLNLDRTEAMLTTDVRERRSCSMRRQDLVPDRRRDSTEILAGGLQTLDQVVECHPIDTQLRCEFRD